MFAHVRDELRLTQGCFPEASQIVQLALFDFFNLALNRCSGHSCGGFPILAAFNYLTGTKDGFIDLRLGPDCLSGLC